MFVPTMENGQELCIRVCFGFFHAKAVTTNNDWTGLNDISLLSSLSRDLNDNKKKSKKNSQF